MVEDILTDGQYADSGLKVGGGLATGSIWRILDEYGEKTDNSVSESAGKAAFVTAIVDGLREAVDYAGVEVEDLGAEDYPEFWAGATLGHQGMNKIFEYLD